MMPNLPTPPSPGAPVDLTTCDREPIHVPGAIQAHGLLFGVDGDDLVVRRVAGDVERWLGRKAEALLGTPLLALADDANRRALLAAVRDAARRPVAAVPVALAGATFEATLHRSGGLVVVELERGPSLDDAAMLALHARVGSATARLTSADGNDGLLRSAAAEIRAITGFDRVMIYRFHEDAHGEVVAEERREDLEPFLGLHYPASDIPAQARRLYEENLIRVIPDIAYAPAPILPAGAEPLDLTHAVLRSVSSIHVEYLTNMSVSASMSVSILHEGRLWGLVACHHYAGPKLVPCAVRLACETLGHVLASLSAEKQRRAEADARLRANVTRGKLLDRAAAAASLPAGLVEGAPSLLDVVDSEGVAVLHDGRWITRGRVPSPTGLDRVAAFVLAHADDVVAVDDLPRHVALEPAETGDDAGGIPHGLLALAFPRERRSVVLFFRPEATRVIDWAGRPDKIYKEGPNGPRLSPRGSFALFQETVRGHALPWTSLDVDAARALRGALLELELRRADEQARDLELDQARERYELAARATNLGIWDYNPKANVLVWDARCKALFDLPPEADITYTESFVGSLHPDDREATEAAVASSFAKGGDGAYHAVFRIRRPRNLPTRWIEARGRTTFGEDGSAERFTGTVLDVTASRLASEERDASLRQAKESEERFRTMADGVPAMIWVTDEGGACTYLNRVWYEFTGQSEREALGLGWLDAIHPEDEPAARRIFLASNADRVPFSLEYRLRQRDGLYRWAIDTGVPRFDASGAFLGYVGSVVDIADRKAAEEEREALLRRESEARRDAEQANRLKDEFIATVSHELRTPLSAMLGWATLLRNGSLPTERVDRALETIERNARAQGQLIEDLLDVSRIMAGKLTLAVESVEVRSVVEQALESVRPAADAKGVRLQSTLDSSVRVMGDPQRVQQVVWNLVSNAVKFTPRGGRVQVTLVRDHSAAEITVADTGQGIAADFLPHVFERFRQEEGGSTRRAGGLGLGLSIVRHLVELHGGVVSAESEGLGKGSTFRVRLPISVATRRDSHDGEGRVLTPPGNRIPCPPELRGLVVVVVDDEPDTRELVKTLLEGCEAIVHTADSVARALELVEEKRPDLVVSDIGMPDEDGYSLIAKVRALPPERGGRTFAIALTAYARTEDRTRALLAGFQAHVPKPVEPIELFAVAASLAARRP